MTAYHVAMFTPLLGSWSSHAAMCGKCNGYVPFPTQRAAQKVVKDALVAGLGAARVVEPCDCTGLCGGHDGA